MTNPHITFKGIQRIIAGGVVAVSLGSYQCKTREPPPESQVPKSSQVHESYLALVTCPEKSVEYKVGDDTVIFANMNYGTTTFTVHKKDRCVEYTVVSEKRDQVTYLTHVKALSNYPLDDNSACFPARSDYYPHIDDLVPELKREINEKVVAYAAALTSDACHAARERRQGELSREEEEIRKIIR